ncbi:radical SAM protein [Pseudomonas citronellolis]|uniref:radical SAM protein n=1 Tax=Pseudomonas citronellolis TaxID=53408 RepID=UPI0009EE053B|nr:radical SAM protein [Pseudomonas citronellolis]
MSFDILSSIDEIRNKLRADIPARFNEFGALNRQWLRYLGALQGMILPPYEVLIHPSSSCNLRCDWCIGEYVPQENEAANATKSSIVGLIASDNAQDTRDGMFLANELSNPKSMMKLVEGIVDYKKREVIQTSVGPVSHEFRVEAVSFSGLIGEPLSSKASVADAINFLSENQVRTGIFTNATLIDGVVLQALLRANYVLVSLDADNPETYSKLKFGGRNHGRKLFKRAIENVRWLSEEKKKNKSDLEINCSFILYPENYHEVYGAAVLAKEIGISNFRIKQDNSGSKRLSRLQAQYALELIGKAKNHLDCDTFKVVSIHKDLSIDETRRNFRSCQITDLMAAVGSDGCLYPCNYHPRPGGINYGDAVALGFKEVWEGNSRRLLKCKIPHSCPPTCDPFKNRANALMQSFRDVYEHWGLGMTETLLEELNRGEQAQSGH